MNLDGGIAAHVCVRSLDSGGRLQEPEECLSLLEDIGHQATRTWDRLYWRVDRI